jgi:hypothetical protein
MYKFISDLFEWRLMLVPISIEHIKSQYDSGFNTYTERFKRLRIFGFRIAKWSTLKFD